MLRSLFGDNGLSESDNYYQALKAYRIDPNQDFNRVKSRIGLAAATSYVQLYFNNLNRNKRFRRELELHQSEQNELNREHDVLIVLPPHTLISKRQTQLFLKQAMGLGTSGGFAFVSHAQLNTDSVLHGAKRLLHIVEEKKKAGRKLLIVSYSFGSAFVRVMMDHVQASELSHVKGWLNVSGLIFGSPRFHCSDKKTLFNSITRSQRSFSSEQRYFLNPLDEKGIKTVHFLGLKNDGTLSLQDQRQREYLKAWGPSDGLLPFAPYQGVKSPVIGLLDQGHQINLTGISSTFVRTLSSMVSTVPIKREIRDFQKERPLEIL